ncbi:hypothetical protein M422DRAFT_243756 [Sphaerobolus stellatus SS14]|nr:hypothetical protein M422DRAFT_243756 [Sphaerobolus stellatus SS14]
MAVAHVCGGLPRQTHEAKRQATETLRTSFRASVWAMPLIQQVFPSTRTQCRSSTASQSQTPSVLALYKAVAEIPETSGEARLFQHAMSRSSLVDCTLRHEGPRPGEVTMCAPREAQWIIQVVLSRLFRFKTKIIRILNDYANRYTFPSNMEHYSRQAAERHTPNTALPVPFRQSFRPSQLARCLCIIG